MLNRIFCLFLFFLSMSGVVTVAWADSEPPSLSLARENFGKAYQCLQDRGVATFSVKVSSDQLRDICRTLQITPPDLWFDFRSPASFSLRPLNLEGIPVAKQQLMIDLYDVLKNSVEGFFQAWEPVAYANPIPNGASSSTRMDNGRLIVEYSEPDPNQTVTLTFDSDFRMESMEARDSQKKVASLVKTSWDRQGDWWILRSIQNEFRSNGTMTFMTRMAIENSPSGSFFLPSRVLIQALDGESGKPTQATFEIRLDEYQLSH